MTHLALPPHAPLVLGTYNKKKLLELCELLAPLGRGLKMLTDFPQAITVEETGDTFAANAELKAREQALHLDAWVLSEDSGLSVDALDGRPGVFSARYAGPGATDHENNCLLIQELTGVPTDRRTAHYTCHVALSDPSGQIVARSEAYCRGRIRASRSGPPALATIRCSRSSSITAPSASWAWRSNAC